MADVKTTLIVEHSLRIKTITIVKTTTVVMFTIGAVHVGAAFVTPHLRELTAWLKENAPQ
jgi:hypothetical protein